MKSFHVSLSLASLLVAGVARGQISTGFEAPFYSAGVSIIGREGWMAGSTLGSSQTASSAMSYSGGQSLVFDNTSATDLYSVKQMVTLLTGTAYTVSTKIYVSSATEANRNYGIYLANGSGSSAGLQNTVLGMTISGDGAIRAGKTWDYTDGTPLAKAAAGTFANRWLSLDVTLDGKGNGTTKLSGFSDGSSFGYAFATLTAPTNVQLGSDWIDFTSQLRGIGAFDNFSIVPQAVPEPATLAALGVGALVLTKRKRK